LEFACHWKRCLVTHNRHRTAAVLVLVPTITASLLSAQEKDYFVECPDDNNTRNYSAAG
jgi:hypothetical protein